MALFEPQTRMIKERECKVSPFPALEALKLKMQLIKLLGPGIGQLIGSVGSIDSLKDGFDTKLDGTGLAKSIATLMDQLDEGTFLALVRRLFSQVSLQVNIEGKNVILLFGNKEKFEEYFDIAFLQRLMDMYEIIAFVMEVNYPDFFALIAGFGRRMIPTGGSVLPDASDKS